MPDSAYSDALECYKNLVAETIGGQLKGRANPYTSMNGNMFSFLDKAGMLCFRLSKEDREAFVETYATQPVVQYGAVMKEYVHIPPQVVADLPTLKVWFAKCVTYVQTLPAKPTKRK